MQKGDAIYQKYLTCLEKELVPAFGCTEPAAVAYASALASETLGEIPNRIDLCCSGNIIKNVKSVIVPNSGGLKGLEVAAAAGILAKGHSDDKLEVLSRLPENNKEAIEKLLGRVEICLHVSDSPCPFDIHVLAEGNSGTAETRILGTHTNVVLIKKGNTVLFGKEITASDENILEEVPLTVKDILAFAECVCIEDVREILDRQISCNTAISEEGLRNDYGANIGSVLLSMSDTVDTRLKACAAAGSDARMSGCEMPVVINSGSGNQGITVSVPVIEYARLKGFGREELYRALVVSNLLAIYQRAGIGCLSAYCGAINAGVAAVCGVAFLDGGRLDTIAHILSNGLAISSGIICDGAKPSCASKIAMGIESGWMGYEMYRHDQQFYNGEGIVKNSVDATIAAVARLGRYGMRETDREILKIMINE